MNLEAIRQLDARELEILHEALRSGRLGWPPSDLALQRVGISNREVCSAVKALADSGTPAAVTAALVAVIAAERVDQSSRSDRAELVWSGPEIPGRPSRDTGAVVRELFTQASKRVLVLGYAVHRGNEIFASLARRMDEFESLHVRLCLDIQRARGDTTRAEDLVARFSERFRTKEWPGSRLPEVYYDPRSTELDPALRASLHAKCITVDGEVCLITSANFTPAAQVKNIEVGALLRSKSTTSRLESTIDDLVRLEHLQRML